MAKPIGLLGVYLDLAMSDPIMKAASNPRSRKFAHTHPDVMALQRVTGMYASDIDYLMGFSDYGRLLICRCPNKFSFAYAPAVKSGNASPKPAGLYQKTSEYGVLGRYVSDYDFMGAWVLGPPVRAIQVNWDGHSPLDLSDEGDRLVHDLNSRLVYKIQHGFNDCWLDSVGKPKYRKIGEHFVAFTPGSAHFLLSQAELRTFYRARGLTWRYD